jgi:hypothetical protein
MNVPERTEMLWQNWLKENKPGWSLFDRFSGKGVEVSTDEYNREYEAFMKRLEEADAGKNV